VAGDRQVALIDLQVSSAAFYEALGPEQSHLAFATMQEGTHHNAYGSYQIAKCVLNGIRSAQLPLAILGGAGLSQVARWTSRWTLGLGARRLTTARAVPTPAATQAFHWKGRRK
jgi:hypothetical protein